MPISAARAEELAALCRRFRVDVLTAIHGIQSGHPGGSLSVCEILTLLMQERMRFDGGELERDRLVLSKGHAAPMLYRNLVERGILPADSMGTLRRIDSLLQGHPSIHTPGVDMPAGPLGLGLSSEGEYLDAAIEDGADPAAVLLALQEATSEELPVYSLRVLPEKAENAMAAVGGAVWKATLPSNMPAEGAKTALKAILAREAIILPKKTKTREMELDIRPMIISAAVEDGAVLMTLAAGSKANLSPDMVLGLIAKEAGADPEKLIWQIRRMDLLDHELRSLGGEVE